MAKGKNRILSALFDVRPVTGQGDLDIEKIKQVTEVLDLKEKKTRNEDEQREKAINTRPKRENFLSEEQPDIGQDLSWPLPIEEVPTRDEILSELEKIETADNLLGEGRINLVKETVAEPIGISVKPTNDQPVDIPLEDFYFPEVTSQKYSLGKEPAKPFPTAPAKSRPARPLLYFLMAGFSVALAIPGAAWLSQGLAVKDDVLSSSFAAYQSLLSAQQSLEQADWQQAAQNFSSAQANFLQAEDDIRRLGQLTLTILEKLPGGHLVSSGDHLVKVGQNLAQAGQNLASAVNSFSLSNLFSLINLGQPAESNILASKTSLTDLMTESQDNLNQALASIELAREELNQVEIKSLPANLQEEASSLDEKLPLVEEVLEQLTDYSAALLSILGQDNPRQYLLVFQNNSEMRATGGFIGTYGLLTLDKGSIKDLFIEGVFNADGQLREKIIPPRPIQKISTAWSMHDANWFADFPTSAEKIAWFYEKTGGPTVDGVISLTPTVIERLLELTGPIAMPEYEVVLEADNFVGVVQYEVEVDYNKELNQPKKILADFAPRFIEALNQLPTAKKKEALATVFEALKEKHILAHFKDASLEKLAVDEGWAGQLLTTEKDYLSVVSSNINGYKTDRMVEETVEHQAEIQKDGSIIDTLVITRQHRGGSAQYDWWNRVNANYLRVYLPKGSQLISATGQTLEAYQPPVDYQEQGFQEDPLVGSVEDRMVIDQKTGTHIFGENGKTVFGNWLYVSPGQTVILTYQYKLPFKINLTKPSDSYSLLVQKQSGSLGSQFSHQLKFPADWSVSWQHPEQASQSGNSWQLKTDLSIDRFLGVTFEF
jgi:hypothetical protein